MSMTPLSLQTSFSMITPRHQPDRQLRGRQFEAALTRLVAWWTSRFLIDHQAGIKHQSFDEAAVKASRDRKGKAKAKEQEDSEDDMEEVLPSPSVNLRDKGKGRAELFLGEGDSFEESSSPNGGASAIPSKKPLIRLRKSRPKGQRLGALMRQRKRRCLSSCSSF